ncbi:hypothetical protein D0469_14305 [Peribacillus saganii]|uniref:Uncharacterized protein n=1 Tax=Peribacillus saganii TaxID=2303992 RepID=A0A372LN82_9BACI|nr:hypothetical protein [Peribacillus saganii]RFU67579.1 hypothetical protein D0469_14305 [Peribacillus saganii]
MADANGVLRPIEGTIFHRELTLSNEELDKFQMGTDANSFLNRAGLSRDAFAVNRENFLR